MKIAILGGGVGAMTAAYWLTNPTPDGPPVQHDITIYQLGWRLGGKGASGRNAVSGQRIEEHGLHIWMGFYANAFRMIRAAYEELGRPPGAPLATWEEAFTPQSVITMMDENVRDEWMKREWVVAYPLRPGSPGDQTGYPPPCGYLGTLVNKVRERVERFIAGHHHDDCTPPHPPSEAHEVHLKTLHALLDDAGVRAGAPHPPGQRGDLQTGVHDHTLLEFALVAAQKVIGIGLEFSDVCLSLQRELMLADMGVACALGILRDLCHAPWDAIDDQEWRAWMLRNGLHAKTEWCGAIRAMYDLVFAYRGGITDQAHADVAAGTATCAAMRIMFDYYDGVFMRMEAGMGDTIFTPLYQILRKRGVKFEFFHRLRDVVPSADGKSIDELHIGVQATTFGGAEYRPLVTVNQLECWPSDPLLDQLVQGKELREQRIDLEAYDAPWPDVESLVLKRENGDFDLVVFGLSLGAVPFVCPKLLEQKENWRQMVEHVKIVETQAFQFWLDRNIADLGWPPALDGRCYGELAVLSTFVEPCDTWADMSHLIPREQWLVPVQNISYFCGPIADGSTLEAVVKGARAYVDGDISSLWTRAAPNGKFLYESLCVNSPTLTFTEDERFIAQYFRINNQPTEKYVLSVSGSTKYRIDPASPGYDNMVLAGDWVKNGFAIGCVESAVLGGMKGVQPYCPGMVIVE